MSGMLEALSWSIVDSSHSVCLPLPLKTGPRPSGRICRPGRRPANMARSEPVCVIPADLAIDRDRKGSSFRGVKLGRKRSIPEVTRAMSRRSPGGSRVSTHAQTRSREPSIRSTRQHSRRNEPRVISARNWMNKSQVSPCEKMGTRPFVRTGKMDRSRFSNLECSSCSRCDMRGCDRFGFGFRDKKSSPSGCLTSASLIASIRRR